MTEMAELKSEHVDQRPEPAPRRAADLWWALSGALVGLAFSLSLGLVVAAVQTAAGFLDIQTGFSYATLVDPMTNQQGGALAQVYSIVAVMVFLFTGGEITGEFLISTGYLPGAHSSSCPIYELVARKNPPWMKAVAP